MSALSSSDKARLGRVLGMTGSDHDGEVCAAARAANRFVREHGTTWPEVLGAGPQPEEVRPGPRWRGDDEVAWRRQATACLKHPQFIDKWENTFLTGLPRFPRLSKKQRFNLDNIVTRLRNAGCGL